MATVMLRSVITNVRNTGSITITVVIGSYFAQRPHVLNNEHIVRLCLQLTAATTAVIIINSKANKYQQN